MRLKNGYKTKQKQLILECLKNNTHKHMTVEEIYSELVSNGDKVGMATIYRNLAILADELKIKKFNVESMACYQYIEHEEACKNHYHLKCVKCSKIYHVDLPEFDLINKIIGEKNKFLVDNEKIILYGKCKEC